MATYEYETIPQKKGQKVKRYEMQQKMSEDAYTKHPETGEPIKRVISGGAGSIFNGTSILSMNNPPPARRSK